VIKNCYVSNDVKNFKIDKAVVHRIIHGLKKAFDFSVLNLELNFVSEKTIHTINKNYLNHDNSTDIITFNYGETSSELDGEIFISIHDVKLNAKKFGCKFDEELLRVIIHGILHMLGYEDYSKKDYIEMKKKENLFLDRLRHLIRKDRIIYDC
jgi:rRNA maturation RNase YbeY